MSRRWIPLTLVLITFAGVCDPGNPFAVVAEVDESFSFETGLDGWTPSAVHAEAPSAWSVDRSSDAAVDGAFAIRMSLDNLSGMGKVWIERRFMVSPEEEYTVELRFMLGTSDTGAVNLWSVIAGVHDAAPSSTGVVSLAGDTGNGAQAGSGLVWVEKRLSYSFTTDEAQSSAWVGLGVAGTWETERAYFLDDVQVVFTRR